MVGFSKVLMAAIMAGVSASNTTSTSTASPTTATSTAAPSTAPPSTAAPTTGSAGNSTSGGTPVTSAPAQAGNQTAATSAPAQAGNQTAATSAPAQAGNQTAATSAPAQAGNSSSVDVTTTAAPEKKSATSGPPEKKDEPTKASTSTQAAPEKKKEDEKKSETSPPPQQEGNKTDTGAADVKKARTVSAEITMSVNGTEAEFQANTDLKAAVKKALVASLSSSITGLSDSQFEWGTPWAEFVTRRLSEARSLSSGQKVKLNYKLKDLSAAQDTSAAAALDVGATGAPKAFQDSLKANLNTEIVKVAGFENAAVSGVTNKGTAVVVDATTPAPTSDDNSGATSFGLSAALFALAFIRV